MTTYRPGYHGPHGRGKHLRHDKHRDTIFSDEATANTDWIPIKAGDIVNLMVHAAQLKRSIQGGKVIANEYDIVRLAMAPVGSIHLQFKLGGEKDEHAAVLNQWNGVTVGYSQPFTMAGFIRVDFSCMRGQPDSQNTDELGTELTPHGMFVSLEVQRP